MSPHPSEPDERTGPVLLAIASAIEFRAVADGFAGGSGVDARPWAVTRLAPGVEAILTGVGKANAAGGVAHVLEPARHAGVISLGLGGALPGGPGLGRVVLGSASVFADEGVQTPEGFIDCRAMGFPLVPGESDRIAPDGRWASRWLGLVDEVGVIATVSACSGTDALALEVRARTGAIIEAMEGAAVGLAVRAIDPEMPFAELRVVSNTTGDRGEQRWDLPGALGALSGVLGRLGFGSGADRA